MIPSEILPMQTKRFHSHTHSLLLENMLRVFEMPTSYIYIYIYLYFYFYFLIYLFSFSCETRRVSKQQKIFEGSSVIMHGKA
jgi:hypothetical protein